VRKGDNLPPSCAVVTKSGNLNFLEPSGPLRACNGTAFTCLLKGSSDAFLFLDPRLKFAKARKARNEDTEQGIEQGTGCVKYITDHQRNDVVRNNTARSRPAYRRVGVPSRTGRLLSAKL